VALDGFRSHLWRHLKILSLRLRPSSAAQPARRSWMPRDRWRKPWDSTQSLACVSYEAEARPAAKPCPDEVKSSLGKIRHDDAPRVASPEASVCTRPKNSLNTAQNRRNEVIQSKKSKALLARKQELLDRCCALANVAGSRKATNATQRSKLTVGYVHRVSTMMDGLQLSSYPGDAIFCLTGSCLNVHRAHLLPSSKARSL
jgi:hypothetical protein